MNQTQTVTATDSPGKLAGIIACILAVAGIFFIGYIFVPLAAIVAIFGTITAKKNNNKDGIKFNIIAWVLIFSGLFTSPILLALIAGGLR